MPTQSSVPIEYLLAAVAGAAAPNSDIVMVLFRAEALSSGGSRSLGASILHAVDAVAGPAMSDAPAMARWRVLQQTRDGIAAARAKAMDASTIVATTNEWSQDMAKAILVPRFLAADNESAMRAIWETLGGHAAHLRQAAELLATEMREKEVSRQREEFQRRREEQEQAEGKSPDAAEKAREALRQDLADSVRADMRRVTTTAEDFFRRLPEAFGAEISVFEKKIATFERHWVLCDAYEASTTGTIRLARDVDALCKRTEMEPLEGLADLADPLLLALLDVGILVPKWDFGRPRLVVANQLTLWLLRAWVDARRAELPFTARLGESFKAWRLAA